MEGYDSKMAMQKLFVFKSNLQKDFAAVVYEFEGLSLPGFLC
jgi:hypothetical protein